MTEPMLEGIELQCLKVVYYWEDMRAIFLLVAFSGCYLPNLELAGYDLNEEFAAPFACGGLKAVGYAWKPSLEFLKVLASFVS